MRKKKNKKIEDKYKDFSYTDMNVEGFSWYENKTTKQKRKELKDLNISRKEKRAIILAAIKAYLPFFLIFLGSFALVFLLLYLWL